MQFSLGNMKELHLIMDATSFSNPHDISSFIRNCPCIEKVFIDVSVFIRILTYMYIFNSTGLISYYFPESYAAQ